MPAWNDNSRIGYSPLVHVQFIIPGTLKQIARHHGEMDWSSHQGANGEPQVWSEAKTEVKDKIILRE